MNPPDHDKAVLDSAIEAELLVFAAVYGLRRWDHEAKASVARSLRAGSLTTLEAHGLANLIEGKHPDGYRLQMVGQGKGWRPALEGYHAFNRCKEIGVFFDGCIAQSSSWEEAIIDTAQRFSVSEATIARNLRAYRLMVEQGWAN